MPLFSAMLGLVLCLVSLYSEIRTFMLIGVSLFIIGLLAQFILGFKNIGWKWKK
jgi:hypothetical protein